MTTISSQNILPIKSVPARTLATWSVEDLFALTTAEIAFRLGYGDDRSLRRSALRWFGASPAALHAEARRPPVAY